MKKLPPMVVAEGMKDTDHAIMTLKHLTDIINKIDEIVEWINKKDSISVERIHETLCLEFSPMCIDNTRLTKVAEAISKLIRGG
jgi:hypothetical protein